MKNKYTIPYHDHDCNACLSCGMVVCWRWQAVGDFFLSSWAPKPRCCMDIVSHLGGRTMISDVPISVMDGGESQCW